MKSIKSAVPLVLICLACFAGTAFAQAAATDPDTMSLVKSVFDAIVHGQWWAAAAAIVVLGGALFRKYEPASWKTGTKGEIIGVASAFVMAAATAIGAAVVAPGAVMSLGVLTLALKVGVAAVGGFEILHRVAGWLVAWGKLPAWATSILSLVTSLIGSDAVTKAEAAGAAAVAANPAPGMAPGKMNEVE